jgi:hypothetical protein
LRECGIGIGNSGPIFARWCQEDDSDQINATLLEAIMRSTATVFFLALSLFASGHGVAGDDSLDGTCLGRVVGLADRYNPATGSGFLALRAGPKTSATQLGELFEGDRVVIVSRRGGWLSVVTANQVQGWVSSKYISSPCK